MCHSINHNGRYARRLGVRGWLRRGSRCVDLTIDDQYRNRYDSSFFGNHTLRQTPEGKRRNRRAAPWWKGERYGHAQRSRGEGHPSNGDAKGHVHAVLPPTRSVSPRRRDSLQNRSLEAVPFGPSPSCAAVVVAARPEWNSNQETRRRQTFRTRPRRKSGEALPRSALCLPLSGSQVGR